MAKWLVIREWTGAPTPGAGLVTFQEGKILDDDVYDIAKLIGSGARIVPFTVAVETLIEQGDRQRFDILAAVVQSIFGAGASGDVVGPAGAVDGNTAVFDGVTGKLIRDAGAAPPTADEKDALAGTTGTPDAANRYVTNSDPRNSNARTPTAHAATHGSGGSDPVAVTNLGGFPGGGATFLRDDATFAAPPGGTDQNVAVSPNDTTPGPLSAKVVAGTAVTLTELNDGGDEDLQVGVDLGTGAAQAAAGNDSRIPTQDENDALQGTSGVPSNANRYVTNADSRNSDARTPTAHAASHASGGSDPVNVTGLAGFPGGTANFLRADGTFAAPPGGGSFDLRDLIVWDHFQSSNNDPDEHGIMGWREFRNGTGNNVSYTGVAGHPGVLSLQVGTAAGGRAALALGDSSGTGGRIVRGGANPLVCEILCRFPASTDFLVANLEEVTLGLGLEWNNDNELNNGLYFRFTPGVDTFWSLVAANAGTRTVLASSTAPATAAWVRLGFTLTTSLATFFVNGVSQGTIATNLPPTTGQGFGLKARGSGGIGAQIQIDYASLTQVTDKET